MVTYDAAVTIVERLGLAVAVFVAATFAGLFFNTPALPSLIVAAVAVPIVDHIVRDLSRQW